MKYERLTIRETFGMPFCAHQVDNDCSRLNCNECPAIINRLAELEDKIEAGTLVELPCKVGDTVYVVYSVEIVEWEVVSIQIFENNTLFRLGHKNTDDYNSFWLGELGDYAFLTKAEAEKRLAELKSQEVNDEIYTNKL